MKIIYSAELKVCRGVISKLLVPLSVFSVVSSFFPNCLSSNSSTSLSITSSLLFTRHSFFFHFSPHHDISSICFPGIRTICPLYLDFRDCILQGIWDIRTSFYTRFIQLSFTSISRFLFPDKFLFFSSFWFIVQVSRTLGWIHI